MESVGDVSDTYADPVVKLQLVVVSGLPARSFTPLVMVTVYCVFAARVLVGSSVAVFVDAV